MFNELYISTPHFLPFSGEGGEGVGLYEYENIHINFHGAGEPLAVSG